MTGNCAISPELSQLISPFQYSCFVVSGVPPKYNAHKSANLATFQPLGISFFNSSLKIKIPLDDLYGLLSEFGNSNWVNQ